MAKFRTHLLLDPDQHKTLAKIAKREGRSISDLAREIVQEGLEQRQHIYAAEQERRLQALEKARQVRQAILQERGDTPLEMNFSELITELREKRDDQILGRDH